MPTTRAGAHGANPFEQARLAARELLRVTGVDGYEVLVVLGPGLSPVAPLLGVDGPGIDLTTLPWFPRLTGRPEAWSTEIGNAPVLVVTGRTHLGQDPVEVVHTVRTAMATGARVVLLVGGATAVDPSLEDGQVVAVADHLDLTGRSPLSGIPPEGNPYVDLTDAWSPRLRALCREVEPGLAEMVYAQVPGPQLTTPAERQMLSTLGAGMVGMTGVLELVAARHLGGEVLGLAVVAGRLVPDEVSATAVVSAETVARILRRVIEQL